MIKILYIGNMLHSYGAGVSVIETLGPQLIESGYSVKFAGNINNKYFRFISIIYKLLLNIKKVDYVLIDTYSTAAFWYSYFTALICWLFDVKYIPILHGGDLPNRIQRSRLASNFLFKNSYLNIAVSNYLKFNFELYGYKSILIPNNIDISKYEFVENREMKPKLLWVRSFDKIYNPIMAAKVLEKLKITYPDAVLCMVGQFKDDSIIEFKNYLIEKKLEKSVEIKGMLPKEEWIKLSKSYSIFLNTTNIDNLPVSLIEAMALGIPIVSTNVGGIPFLIEDNKDGLLVSPNNEIEMVNSIIKLIENRLFANFIIKNGRAKALGFEWSVIQKKWISILK